MWLVSWRCAALGGVPATCATPCAVVLHLQNSFWAVAGDPGPSQPTMKSPPPFCFCVCCTLCPQVHLNMYDYFMFWAAFYVLRGARSADKG